MRIEFQRSDGLSPDVMHFWEQALLGGRGRNRLTEGPEWFRMLGEGYGSRGEAAVAMDGAQIRGILPLLPMERTVAIGMGNCRLWSKRLKVGRVASSDWVWDGGAAGADCLAELCRASLERFPEYQAIYFDRVVSDEGERGLPLRMKACRERLGVSCIRQLPHYRLRLPATYEALLEMRSSKSIREIGRHGRSLEKRLGGTCQMYAFTSEAEWGLRGKELEDLGNRTWQAADLGHRFRLDEWKQVAREGWGRIFALGNEGRLIAFVACYEGLGVLTTIQQGYEPEFSRQYPGELLFLRMLEQVYHQGQVQCIDYGVGAGYHKEKFANEHFDTSMAYVFKRRGRGTLAFRLSGFAMRIEERLRELARSK